jgi:hypothetical protein
VKLEGLVRIEVYTCPCDKKELATNTAVKIGM